MGGYHLQCLLKCIVCIIAQEALQKLSRVIMISNWSHTKSFRFFRNQLPSLVGMKIVLANIHMDWTWWFSEICVHCISCSVVNQYFKVPEYICLIFAACLCYDVRLNSKHFGVHQDFDLLSHYVLIELLLLILPHFYVIRYEAYYVRLPSLSCHFDGSI